MIEIKQFTRPSCGANFTSTQNCVYCGSLLVSSENKGIDLSKTKYINNTRVPNITLSTVQ
jgi:hypothetical protein